MLFSMEIFLQAAPFLQLNGWKYTTWCAAKALVLIFHLTFYKDMNIRVRRLEHNFSLKCYKYYHFAHNLISIYAKTSCHAAFISWMHFFLSLFQRCFRNGMKRKICSRILRLFEYIFMLFHLLAFLWDS